jgi:hypothetical protein
VPAAALNDLNDEMDCASTGLKMSDGAPVDQTDEDGDCFVDCYDGTTGWQGGDVLLDTKGENAADGDSSNECTDIKEGADCDDSKSEVYPDAIEICDGVINNCSTTSLPGNESDDDLDGFVECLDWEGAATTAGGDCDDIYNLTYPDANETCDGVFNNCNHPLLLPFEGATGEDCFCNGTDTAASGFACETAAGGACADAPTSSTAFVDPDEASTSGYQFAVVECYCRSATGLLDTDFDGVDDCVTPIGDYCSPVDAGGDEIADNVLSNPIDPLTSLALSLDLGTAGLGIYSEDSAPFSELDNDADDFVECNVDKSVWISFGRINAGSDCDDTDGLVYPSAFEYCDGQYNNCSNINYDDDIQPSSEADDDGDGYVDCDDEGADWGATSAVEPTGYSDCDDDDDEVFPGAEEVCDGQFNDCDGFDSDGNGTIDEPYSSTGSPSNEADSDGDGYPSCGDGSEDQDCDDTDDTKYPDAAELCDGIFNDCNNPLKVNDLPGVAAKDCFCDSDDSTSGTRSCFEYDGTTACDPSDGDGNEHFVFAEGVAQASSTGIKEE